MMFVGPHPKIRPPTAKIQPVKCQKERLAVFHEQKRCNGVGACLNTKSVCLFAVTRFSETRDSDEWRRKLCSLTTNRRWNSWVNAGRHAVYSVLFTIRVFYIMAVRQKDSLICCTIRNECCSPGNSSLLTYVVTPNFKYRRGRLFPTGCFRSKLRKC